MKKVFVFLAPGFEEVEAVTTIDLLRRAGLTVVTVAVGDSLEISGVHHITLVANQALAEINITEGDAFVLPGGLPGVPNLAASQCVRAILQEANKAGKLLGAICAAPALLGELGFLEGRKATCYPSFEEQLKGYIPTDEAVVTDGNIITGRSAGVTIDFALALITALLGKEASEAVASAIIYP